MNNRFNRKLLMLSAALLMAALTGQSAPVAAQSDKIVIGDLSPLTGPGATALGFSISQGVRSAVNDVNAHGGISVGGKKFEFVYKLIDSRTEPAATLAAAKELIQDNALAAVLPALTPEIAYRAFSDAKVLTFGSAPRSMNPLALDPIEKHPFLFATIELVNPVIEGWLTAIKGLYPDIKRVAVLNVTDPGGKLMDAGVQKAAQKLGLDYVGAEFVDISTTDYSGPLTNLKAKKPDIIYTGITFQTLAATRQALQLEAAPIMWNFSMRPADLKQLGPLRSGIVVMADFRAPFTDGLTPPQYENAVRGLGKLSNGEPLQAGMASSYFDWVHLLARAIEQAGTTTDRDAIAKKMVGLTYEGPFGQVTVLPNHTTSGPVGVIVAKSDSVTIHVYKNNASTNERPMTSYSVKNTWSQ